MLVRPAMNHRLRKFLMVAILSIGFALLVNLLVNNPYTHRLVKAVINEKLAGLTKINLEFQALEVKAFPPTVTVYGVRVSPRSAPKVPLLEAAQIKARLSVFSLLIGEPGIGLLETNELKLSYPLPPEFDGILLNPPPESSYIEWPPIPRLPVDRVVMINSRFSVTLPAAKPDDPPDLRLILDGVNLDYQHHSWKNIDLEVELPSTNLFVWDRHIIQDAVFTADIKLRRNKIISRKLELSSQSLNLDGGIRGELDIQKFQTPDLKAKKIFQQVLNGIKLEVNAKVQNSDLATLGRFLAVDQTNGNTNGDVTFSLKLPFEKDQSPEWFVKGKAQVQNAQLYGFKLHDSEAAFHIDEKRMNFEQINLIKGGQKLGTATGTLGFDASVPFTFNAAPDGLSLVELLDTLGVKDFQVLDGQIRSPKIAITGTGLPFHMGIEGEGRLQNVTVPLIKLPTTKFPDAPDADISLKLGIDSESVTFDGTRAYLASTPEQLVEQNGVYDPQTSALEISGNTYFTEKRGINLHIASPRLHAQHANYFAQLPLKGLARATTTVKGPYNKILVQVTGSGDNMEVAGIPLDHVETKLVVDPQKSLLQIGPSSIQWQNAGRADIHSGSLGINDDLPLTLNYKLQQVPERVIAGIMNLASPETHLSFEVPELAGTLSGPALFPLAYQLDTNVTLANLRMDDQKLADRVFAKVVSNNKEWRIESGQAQLGTLQLALDAKLNRKTLFNRQAAEKSQQIWEKLGWHESDALQLHLKTLPTNDNKNTQAQGWNHLGALPFAGPHLDKLGIAGQITGEAQLEGNLGYLQGSFQGNVSRLEVLHSKLAPVQFRGFVKGSSIELPEIAQGGNAAVGRLNFDFMKAGVPFEWYFSFNSFDLRAFLPEAFYNDPRNYAYVKANWALKGHFNDFWRSHGKLQLNGIDLNYIPVARNTQEKIELHHEFPVVINIDEKGWNLEADRDIYLTSNYGSFYIQTRDNRPPELLNIRMRGDMEMEIFRKLFDVVETARGKLTLTGAITGSIEKPDLLITAEDKKLDSLNASTWEAVSFGITDLPPAFTNIRLNASFHNNKLEIQKLVADKGKRGTVSITGSVNPFADDNTSSVLLINLNDLEFNRLPITVFKSADITLDGDLVLTGHKLPLKLAGNVNLQRVQSLTSFDVRNQIIDAIRRRKISTASVPADPILNFDVQVSADNSIFIKNRNIVVTLGTELKILGNNEQPLVLGQMSVYKGKFNYKRDFVIQRGIIQFDEPVSPPDPRLDIIGESQVGRYKVQVLVTGYASDPKVSLAVDPPNRPDGTAISKMDILLLLTSGQLPDNERSLGASQDAARSEALNLVIGQFEEPIERLFDLSGQNVVRQIYLDTYASSETGDPVARLNLPINLSDDVNLIFQLDNESNMKVSSEYSIHEGISVSGSFDKKNEDEQQKSKSLPADTDTGVDLKFRFSFP